MAGISELPSDHQQPQGQTQTQPSTFRSEADLWNQRRKDDIVRLVASSVMNDDAESIGFRGGGVNFDVSFKPPSSGQPTMMHATMGSFMRNDPMSRPMAPPQQCSTCSMHPSGHPLGPQSSGQFGQSFGGQTGQPMGGQPFGQSYQSQPGWPGLSSQAPQPPQGYFDQSVGSSMPPQFQGPGPQSNFTYNGQPGSFNFGSAPPPPPGACCSVGSGFCTGTGNGMPTPPHTPGGGGLFGPGAPNVTQFTYDPNEPIFGSNATSNTSNPWQQQQPQSFGGPQPPLFNQFGAASSGQASDALNSAVRDLCASSCMTRAEVFQALSQGTGCGLPGCGCDACQRANKLSVVRSLVENNPHLLYSISRTHHHP